MTNSQNLPRDVFLYLLAIVALGISAVNFGTLLFQFINIYIPDAIADQFRYTAGYYNTIRWALASLVIVFPVYLWVTRFLHRDIARMPEKRELKIRRWLLYLTLFVAGVVIIGDLVALVYSFLQGELTTRFILKIASILFIASSIFWYYLNDLRDSQRQSLKGLSWFIIGAVIVATVSGFAIAGSPMSQRDVRSDERRVQDLQSMQWQIISFWQGKNRLPDTIDELRNDISGYVPPVDPITGQPYSYSAQSSLRFQLCATFQTSSQDESNPTMPRSYAPEALVNDTWQHDAGHQCFTRTIDPDLYPTQKR
ncbi:MAG: hypothetical protein KW806_00045 [Candidatus Yanofskybacteria bacterium]|nr:hypothetical protein [Candidatus Yanofskybacteria bacterium]